MKLMYQYFFFCVYHLTSKILTFKINILRENNNLHRRYNFLTGKIDNPTLFSKNLTVITFHIEDKYYLQGIYSDRNLSYRT